MMGKFGFTKGRKKAPAQLAVMEPLSKAHKILGSTPLNIDSPKIWDDGSSSFSTATVSTIPSYTGTEDDYDSDHEVAIARSDGDWADSDILPAITEASSLDDINEYTRGEVNGVLRKSQSSSTIKSWYDKSKQPLSISQQTSSLAMAKGLQADPRSPTSPDGIVDSKAKKKPARLDFSSLTSNRRLSRKNSLPQLHTDGTIVGAPDSNLRSPSIRSLLSPTGDRHRESRRIQKRLTKERIQSPISEAPRPATSGTSGTSGTNSTRVGTSSSKDVPSLYDHYEQMMDRQFMLEESDSEEDEPPEVTNSQQQNSRAEEDVQWSHDSLPATPRTAYMAKPTSTSPGQRSQHTPSPQNKSIRASKTVQPVDLQSNSVLMLDSDSESEEEAPPPQRSFSRQSGQIPSSASRTSTQKPPSRVSQNMADHRASRSSKRASFAPANTYITIPNSENANEERVMSPTDSRSSTPFGSNSVAPSCRTSLMSNYSVHSTGEYIHEAKVIRMLPAHRPARVTVDDNDGAAGRGRRSKPLEIPSIPEDASDTDQSSPSVSPTSMEFFLRSAHSSLDGSAMQGRIMAVSREEELLLESLRYKQREAQEKAAMEAEAAKARTMQTNSHSNEEDGTTGTGADVQNGTDENLDFEFPAPPAFNRESFGNSLMRAASHRTKSSGSPDKSPIDRINEEDSASNHSSSKVSASPPRLAPLKSILKKSSSEPGTLAPQEDILLYMDEPEPSPDLDDFSEFDYLAPQTFEPQSFEVQTPETPVFEPQSEDDIEFLPSTRYGDPPLPTNRFSGGIKDSMRAGARSGSLVRSPSAMATVPEDGEMEETTDVPRPDSPISPDSFPSVPEVRTTLSTMARLSAVGHAPSEPGWWGDDD